MARLSMFSGFFLVSVPALWVVSNCVVHYRTSSYLLSQLGVRMTIVLPSPSLSPSPFSSHPLFISSSFNRLILNSPAVLYLTLKPSWPQTHFCLNLLDTGMTACDTMPGFYPLLSPFHNWPIRTSSCFANVTFVLQFSSCVVRHLEKVGDFWQYWTHSPFSPYPFQTSLLISNSLQQDNLHPHI